MSNALDVLLGPLVILGVGALFVFAIGWPLIAVELGKRRGNMATVLGSLGAWADLKPYLPADAKYRDRVQRSDSWPVPVGTWHRGDTVGKARGMFDRSRTRTP